MKPYYLFLDDERYPHRVNWVSLPIKPFIIARNYDEFVSIITRRGLPKFISFDHDLAQEHYNIGGESNFRKFDYSRCTEKTGFHCVKWLVDYCLERKLDVPDWETHTMNPCGAENMNSLLKSYRKFYQAEK